MGLIRFIHYIFNQKYVDIAYKETPHICMYCEDRNRDLCLNHSISCKLYDNCKDFYPAYHIIDEIKKRIKEQYIKDKIKYNERKEKFYKL